MAGELSRRLGSAGFQVSWMASAQAPVTDKQEYRVVRVPAVNLIERLTGVPFPVPTPMGLARIVREVERTELALIHSHSNLISFSAILAARLFHKPFVLVQHGSGRFAGHTHLNLAASMVLTVTRQGIEFADGVVFITENALREASGRRLRREPAHIPNGVDVRLFAPPATYPAVLRAREALGVPGKAMVGLFAGRFAAGKGLYVMRRLAVMRPDVTWLFVGRGRFDPRAWQLPNVIVFDRIPHCQMPRFYQASDVLVLPSSREGYPLVVSEALASGLAVICSSEVSQTFAGHKVSGVPITGDEHADAQAISAALDIVEPRRTALAVGAEQIPALPTWDTVAGHYARLLREVWIAASLPERAPLFGRDQ